jgi:hypothetical protein
MQPSYISHISVSIQYCLLGVFWQNRPSGTSFVVPVVLIGAIYNMLLNNVLLGEARCTRRANNENSWIFLNTSRFARKRNKNRSTKSIGEA